MFHRKICCLKTGAELYSANPTLSKYLTARGGGGDGGRINGRCLIQWQVFGYIFLSRHCTLNTTMVFVSLQVFDKRYVRHLQSCVCVFIFCRVPSWFHSRKTSFLCGQNCTYYYMRNSKDLRLEESRSLIQTKFWLDMNIERLSSE